MFTKNICLFLIALSTFVLFGCEVIPEKRNPMEDKEPKIEAPAEISTECHEKCSDFQLRKELAYWINSNNSLGFFKWLDHSIANNGDIIISLLSNEQELKNNDPMTNLFLSLTLSYPGTGFRDTSLALQRLETFEKNWFADDHNKRFSIFIKNQLEDRKRMVAQRSSLRKQITTLKQELLQEQENVTAARTQLDQLRSVEKSLLRQQSEETKKYRVVK